VLAKAVSFYCYIPSINDDKSSSKTCGIPAPTSKGVHRISVSVSRTGSFQLNRLHIRTLCMIYIPTYHLGIFLSTIQGPAELL